jgi:hypothetical protein
MLAYFKLILEQGRGGGGGGAMAKEAVERRSARARRLFERLGMQSQRVSLENGTVMHCWVPPSSAATRPPLVLVHGFGWEGVTTWELQLEAFLEAEFAVYVPDLVFFGESTTTSPRRSEAFQAECLIAMLQRLGVQSGVNVLGISYGGLVAFAMASMFPSLLHKVSPRTDFPCTDEHLYLGSMFRSACMFYLEFSGRLLSSSFLTPKHPRKPKWLFADLGRLLLMQ